MQDGRVNQVEVGDVNDQLEDDIGVSWHLYVYHREQADQLDDIEGSNQLLHREGEEPVYDQCETECACYNPEDNSGKILDL